MKRRTLLVAISVGAVATIAVMSTRIGANLFGLVAEPAYFIPAESSVLRFSPTVMNPGSGDWWLYGEDSQHFYALGEGSGSRYRAFPKAAARDCAGFHPTDQTTWCADG